VFEHVPLGLVAQVDVQGHAVGPELQRVLDRGHQDLGVGVGGQRRGGREVDDQAHVAAASPVGAAGQALVHEHGVGPAFGHLVDGLAHVDQPVDGSHGDAVVHGHDDGAVGVAVEDAFQAYGFSKEHGRSLRRVGVGLVRGVGGGATAPKKGPPRV
jgi:hypothetical protein